MFNDQPSRTDELGRMPFAQSLARTILTQSDPAPQVIAIDGAWGDGKTTVCGFLQDALQAGLQKVVWFNPWQYRDEDAMVRGFATQLASALGMRVMSNREQFLEVVVERDSVVQPLAELLGPIGRFMHLGAKTTRLTASQVLIRAKSCLNEHGSRVTIIVDDPDRLEVDLLMALFRLIKLTADFEWLTFVLAMDCKAIVRIVSHRFGIEEEGRRFVEKIVQVPLRLPRVTYTRMREYTLNLIQQVLTDLGIDLPEKEVQRFRNGFDDALMPLIETPRLAKQCANAVRFVLGLLHDEVNTVDVILLESLRLLLPTTFEAMIEHVAPPASKILDEDLTSNLRRSRAELAQEASKKILPSTEVASSRRGLNRLLATLFPGTFGVSETTENVYQAWFDDQRVACSDYLWRYLHSAVPDHDVADADMRHLLALASDGDQSTCNQLVRAMLDRRSAKVGANKLRRLQFILTDSQRRVLAISIAHASSAIPEAPAQTLAIETPFGETAMAAAGFIREVNPVAERYILALEIVSIAAGAQWAFQFVQYLTHDGGDTIENGESLTEVETEGLRCAAAEKVMAELETVVGMPSLELLRKASSCDRYGFGSRLKAWSMSRALSSTEFVKHLGCAMMAWSYGDSGREFLWPGDESALTVLSAFFDLEWFRENVKCPTPPTRDFWLRGLSPQEVIFRLVTLAIQGISNNQGPDG